MFCLLSLIVFSLLGLFSATHRRLAGEAFECVFKRVTLRPCETGFDKKIQGKIIGKLLNKSVPLAKFINQHFELMAWIFFILLMGSTFWVVRGGYNFYLYGSCNGLNAAGFCALDPSGENNKVSQLDDSCSLNPPSESNLDLTALNLDDFPTQDFGSKDQVVLIGCYNCDYTRKSYPLIQKLVDKYKPNYTFVHFPVKAETAYISNYAYCINDQDQQKLWQFNDILFSSKKEEVADESYIQLVAAKIGLESEKLTACVKSTATQNIVEKQLQQIRATGIYGTPTIFINGKALVGPKPYRVYQRMLGKLW